MRKTEHPKKKKSNEVKSGKEVAGVKMITEATKRRKEDEDADEPMTKNVKGAIVDKCGYDFVGIF